MSSLPLKLNWDLSQNRWATEIEPVLQFAPNQGLLLKNIKLVSGINQINTLLSRMQQGWILIDQDAPASIHRSAPLGSSVLTLTSSAQCNVSLWVF